MRCTGTEGRKERQGSATCRASPFFLASETYRSYVRRDFQITNAALGEELASADGRSVVKLTYQNADLSDIDDLDSEDESIDSDMAEELREEFELSDDEMGEDEVIKEKKPKVNGVKSEAKAAKEEEEDSEGDDSFEDDEDILTTVALCSLTAGKIEQATVNLTICEGTVAEFEVVGPNAVYLTGNFIHQDYGHDHGHDGSDSDSEDLGFDDGDDYYRYGDDIPAGKISEINDDNLLEAKPAKKEKTKVAKVNGESKPAKVESSVKSESKPLKRKADEIDSPAKTEALSTDGLSKNQKKKLAKKSKLEGEGGVKAEKSKVEQAKSQKRTLPSGLIIEDVKPGDGPAARTGKRLGMRYVGKLENGKQFDSNTAGKPFTFVLGRGEVIRGWDEGLAGMAVGGERRLTIPPQLAYGNQKVPGIPKGSTLKFDVKLVSVN
ncbi:hypothetical protein M231_03307 [Tremella mesenterica]|uniref:FK506-binding protein n=1 Tax=Tremella mesenterica TaxID=5217 RepID=A0A4Q1BNN3_TREME|nr:hypothetical protein M231_03307 [Tremella mesenterica]